MAIVFNSRLRNLIPGGVDITDPESGSAKSSYGPGGGYGWGIGAEGESGSGLTSNFKVGNGTSAGVGKVKTGGGLPGPGSLDSSPINRYQWQQPQPLRAPLKSEPLTTSVRPPLNPQISKIPGNIKAPSGTPMTVSPDTSQPPVPTPTTSPEPQPQGTTQSNPTTTAQEENQNKNKTRFPSVSGSVKDLTIGQESNDISRMANFQAGKNG